MKKLLGLLALGAFISNVQASTENLIKITLERPDNYEGDITYELKNLDTEEIKSYTFNTDYYEIHLEEDINHVALKEIECDKHYELNPNEYEIDFTNNAIYEINYTYIKKICHVSWLAKYNDIRVGLKDEYQTTLSLYDDEGNYLKDINTNSFDVEANSYIIKDNLYNHYYDLDIYDSNYELILTEDLYNALWVDDKLDTICDEEICYNFTKKGNLVLLDEPLKPGNYYLNGVLNNVDDTLSPFTYQGLKVVVINLIKTPFIEDNVNEENEEVSDESIIIEDEESHDEDELVIFVPDTGRSYKNENIYVEKKYYYFIITNCG